MPTYEYQCDACGREVEAWQKISDPALVDCPACGEPELKKRLSAASFRLKGGGWYETDFKTGNKKNLAGDTTPGDGGTDGKGDAGSAKGDKAAKAKDDKSGSGDSGKAA